jgi:lysophospholipase L1-like esterase
MNEDIAPLKGINHGFGGSKLSDVAYYIERLIANQRKLKGIVLYVGNDIVGSELDKTPMQDLQLVKYITTKIKMLYPTLPIYWIEISPSEKRWAVWNTIQEANAMIKDYCNKTENLHFIEISSGFLSPTEGTKTEYYRPDKLHYNLEGYKVFGQLVKKQIN